MYVEKVQGMEGREGMHLREHTYHMAVSKQLMVGSMNLEVSCRRRRRKNKKENKKSLPVPKKPI